MMKKFFFREKKGFTLIELLIVVAIIGIIAGIAIPRFLGVRTKAKVTRAFADMANIGTALEMYYVDKDAYPEVLEVTAGKTALMDGDYISSIPDDPFDDPDVAGTSYRYYSNKGIGDPALTSATLWLLVSNGPDTELDVNGATFVAADWDAAVAGQIGGPDGILNAYGTDTTDPEDGGAAGDGAWTIAGSSRDLGDIGRGGP